MIFLKNLFLSILSLIKLIIGLFGCSSKKLLKEKQNVAILGNGPSLDDNVIKFLKRNNERLEIYVLNFFTNSPHFFDLKPSHLFGIDPYFILKDKDGISPSLVEEFFKIINLVNWTLTICIPCDFVKFFEKKISNNNIKLKTIKNVRISGFEKFEYFVSMSGFGNIKCHVVAHRAILEAIKIKYNKIFLFGFDSDLFKKLDVDFNNKLFYNDEHFYNREGRIVYLDQKLEDQLLSNYFVFNGFTKLAKFAAFRKIEIINCTATSKIDAFTKKEYNDIIL